VLPALKVNSGKTLLISGPASTILVEGAATLLGAPVESGKRIVVAEGKQVPVFTSQDSVFHCSFGEYASHVEVNGNTIPVSWTEAADAILELDGSKTIVIGDIDTGKSTFCTYLANLTIASGTDIWVLDADIGQSDLGPPTTISLGLANEYLTNLSSIRADRMFFVGHTSPSSVTEKVIFGISKLASHAYPPPMVINTDGWVADDQAASYKVKMINELAPDIVVGIEREHEVEAILDSFNVTSIRIQPPDFVKPRSREQRKRLRENGYRRFLTNAKTITLPIDMVKTVGGTRLQNHESLIVGLLDCDGFLLSIGILKEIDSKRGSAKIYSREISELVSVEIGGVRISESGKEITEQEI
jgi:polynucleotide 5'-hydroxyl-kinase GRC3/NOL9